jgi:sigma-B regulation protein RsbU (phosphoserine phosphatase)
MLFASILARRLAQPLVDLARHTNRLASNHFQLQSDDLSEIEKRATGKEIKDLARSFSAMQEELNRHIEELKTVTAARERMECELRLAASIQKSALPSRFPAFPDRSEFDLFAVMKPAREVGGDLYDFFFLDDRHLCFLVGDVSDKGVHAALFMMETKTQIKAEALRYASPADVLCRVNATLCANNEQEMFVTLFVAIMDTVTGEVCYSNAGHMPVLRVRAGTRPAFIPMPPGMPVGAMGQAMYAAETIKLAPGEALLLYTDGVTDARRPDGERFKSDRMVESVGNVRDLNARALVMGLHGDVDRFVAGAEQADDIAILAMLYRRNA